MKENKSLIQTPDAAALSTLLIGLILGMPTDIAIKTADAVYDRELIRKGKKTMAKKVAKKKTSKKKK